jgi:hypothetical protein
MLERFQEKLRDFSASKARQDKELEDFAVSGKR